MKMLQLNRWLDELQRPTYTLRLLLRHHPKSYYNRLSQSILYYHPMNMRAVVRTGILGTTISFNSDHPQPTSVDTPTDILIKVKSAAINPVDYKLPRIIGGKVVGIDVSGVVVYN